MSYKIYIIRYTQYNTRRALYVEYSYTVYRKISCTLHMVHYMSYIVHTTLYSTHHFNRHYYTIHHPHRVIHHIMCPVHTYTYYNPTIHTISIKNKYSTLYTYIYMKQMINILIWSYLHRRIKSLYLLNSSRV